jgi:GNAT superfamily N-acetyltransferase
MRQWYSNKFNPSARYFPQIFSAEEQDLVYRCLERETKKTDNRGTSTGAIDFNEHTKFLHPEQDAVLRCIETLADGLNIKDRESAIARQIENNRYLAKKKAFRWNEARRHTPAQFEQWWRSVIHLPLKKRQEAVGFFREKNVSKRPYAMPAMSATVGAFSRDANNQWGRVSVENEHLFSRALPIIRRIDAAFQKSLPERWALQKEFCETIDPRFVISGTCFTTLTVNKNYRTAEHRDSGDLSQGFSNIAVFSNGRKFSGGHLVLPEFNVEICLRPGDLLFIANHEYIHQNTAITNDDPESERLSIVAYAREAFAFSGTLEYESLRERFQRKSKKFSGMWGSFKWYQYLRKELAKGVSLVDEARKSSCLNREIVLLSHLYESDPLWNTNSWEYVGAMPLTSVEDLTTLRALFSAAQFRVARQDRWLTDNKKEEGAQFVDALFIEDGWAFGYCETDSGAAKFNNNRFNVQAVGRLVNFTLPVNKLTAEAFRWLEPQWERSLQEKPVTVCLVRAPTGIAEAPYRYALTTLTRAESIKNKTLITLRKDKRAQTDFYRTSGTLGISDSFNSAPQNEFLLDLGLACRTKRGGILTTEGEPLCDRIAIRSATALSYLRESQVHWRKRALNLGSADYKSRYERVGNYIPLTSPLTLAEVSRPWHWDVTPTRVTVKNFGWQANKHNIKRKVRAAATKFVLESRGAHTELSWKSKYQSPLLLCAEVPPSASLAIWRLSNSEWENGQACLTNGKSFWMFQALSTIVPLRRGTELEREQRAPIKITKPSIVGHLQRSKMSFKEDTSPLLNWLRSNPVFIPTPFTEMSPSLKADYQSTYKKGRANVMAIGGPPCSGKTTLMKKLLESANDWKREKPHKLVDGYFSKKRNTWIIGVYERDGGTFQGTDKLSKALGPALVSFIRQNADKPVNILFEGNNVFVSKTLRQIAELNVNFVILRLMVAKSLKKERKQSRGDAQSVAFLKAKETAVANVARDPLLFDHLVEVRNETKKDQANLIEMIQWFTRRAQPLPADSSAPQEQDKTPWETTLWSKVLPQPSAHIRPVTKKQFIAAMTDHKDDKFAKTFVAKANTQNLWKDCVGYWKGNTLCAAIITKHTARDLKTANLSLLHTFAKHRAKGYGTMLVQDSLHEALRQGCLYYRVSSEFVAAPFYRKLGFKFLGRQKTAELSMFRLNGPSPKDGAYDITDSHIADSVMTKRRGALARSYEVPH